jgi:hypothetical protein
MQLLHREVNLTLIVTLESPPLLHCAKAQWRAAATGAVHAAQQRGPSVCVCIMCWGMREAWKAPAAWPLHHVVKVNNPCMLVRAQRCCWWQEWF